MTVTNSDLNGFRFVKTKHGSVTMPAVIDCSVATAYQGQVNGTYDIDLNVGDPVTRVSTGGVEHCPGAEATPGTLFGVVVGIKPYWNGTAMVFGTALPGGTAWGTNENRRSFVQVLPVDGNIFEVDCVNVGSNDTKGEFIGLNGKNADHIFTATAAQSNGECKLDLTSVGTDAEQWRIWDLAGSMENRNFAADNVKVQVIANEVQMPAYSTTGV